MAPQEVNTFCGYQEPLYGYRINLYTSVVIRIQLYGFGMNQYFSVNMRKQKYGSGIKESFV